MIIVLIIVIIVLIIVIIVVRDSAPNKSYNYFQIIVPTIFVVIVVYTAFNSCSSLQFSTLSLGWMVLAYPYLGRQGLEEWTSTYCGKKAQLTYPKSHRSPPLTPPPPGCPARCVSGSSVLSSGSAPPLAAMLLEKPKLLDAAVTNAFAKARRPGQATCATRHRELVLPTVFL